MVHPRVRAFAPAPLACARVVAGLLALAAIAPTSLAQQTLEAPAGVRMAYTLDTGVLANPRRDWAHVYSKSLTVPDADWLRLHFSEASLDGESYLLVTSTRDGETHRLDAAGLKAWANSTAYLNGDTLDIQLVAAPMSKENYFAIGTLEAGLDEARVPSTRGEAGQCGICNPDNRTASTENWSARLMPVGCSGTIICEDSTYISAGHCVGPSQVIQFNVPASTAGCGLVNPPVADQFPVVLQASVNNGVGSDWAVYRTNPNSLGQRPYERYGQLRRRATVPATVGTATNIWGYGIDVTCTRSQTQQLSPGTITARLNAYYSFNNDVRGGNSGSGYLNAAGEVIGIVTHCAGGCGGNIATRIDIPALAAAINAAMSCDEVISATFTANGASPTIAVSPADTLGNASGVPRFTRSYPAGTVVVATAPASTGDQCLHGWRLNGVDQGPDPVVTIVANGESSAQAVYRSLCCPADRDNGSLAGNPDGGVDVNDLLYFLVQFELGRPAADLDNGSGTGLVDNSTDINDLLYFLARFGEGC